MIKTTDITETSATSFNDVTIETSFNRLKELFPNSCHRVNDGKSNVQFILKVDEDVFTIYDWKASINPLKDGNGDIVLRFNIGAHTKAVAERAKTLLTMCRDIK